MGGGRPNSYNKAAKLFDKYPHLKRFGPKVTKKGKNEPQQSVMEEPMKMYPSEDRVPDFSAYKVCLNHNSSKGSQIEPELNWRSNAKDELGHISDHSDDSLQNNEAWDSFDKGDDSEATKTEMEPEKRPQKLTVEEEKSKEIEEKEKNQNIMDFLESSLSIDIMKPKGIETTEINNTSELQESNETDPSLIASSNSLNIRFYESSQESPDTGKTTLTIW